MVTFTYDWQLSCLEMKQLSWPEICEISVKDAHKCPTRLNVQACSRERNFPNPPAPNIPEETPGSLVVWNVKFSNGSQCTVKPSCMLSTGRYGTVFGISKPISVQLTYMSVRSMRAGGLCSFVRSFVRETLNSASDRYRNCLFWFQVAEIKTTSATTGPRLTNVDWVRSSWGTTALQRAASVDYETTLQRRIWTRFVRIRCSAELT